MTRPLPDKLFFRIGEVAALVGVKPHVLRYWESELGCLEPMKTRGSHRQYRRRDVEIAMLIRRLLHDEGLTMAGVRRRLRELGHDRAAAPVPKPAQREVRLRGALLGVREELEGLLRTLDGIGDEAEREREAPSEVKVHAAVPVPATTRRRER